MTSIYNSMPNAPSLQVIHLPQGPIQYQDCGEGPTLVFIHGLLVNGALWRLMVPTLSQQFRCIVPNLPLGAHQLAMHPETNLTPLGLAQLVADLITGLGLKNVTLVGNDTGGAICQLVAVHHSHLIERLVLSNCDAFENFFPLIFRPFQQLFHIPGVASLMAQVLKVQVARRWLFQLLAWQSFPETLLEDYCSAYIADAGIRRDTTKVVCGVPNRYTLEAARLFADFHQAVLLVWGEDDPFFPLREAEKLQAAFPHAILERVAHAKAFVPEDQSDVFVRLLTSFIHEQPAPSSLG